MRLAFFNPFGERGPSYGHHIVLENGVRTALRDLAANLRALSQNRPEDFAGAPRPVG